VRRSQKTISTKRSGGGFYGKQRTEKGAKSTTEVEQAEERSTKREESIERQQVASLLIALSRYTSSGSVQQPMPDASTRETNSYFSSIPPSPILFDTSDRASPLQ
jgi:hypothetical protein